MTPLFTIHAGEYLAGSYIERRFSRRLKCVDSVEGHRHRPARL
jgi:hypothetical protein